MVEYEWLIETNIGHTLQTNNLFYKYKKRVSQLDKLFFLTFGYQIVCYLLTKKLKVHELLIVFAKNRKGYFFSQCLINVFSCNGFVIKQNDSPF